MSSFGEIVEPGTRTAFEDWDDRAGYIAERNFSELRWKINLEIPKAIDTFLILEGKYLSDCVKMNSHSTQQTQKKLEPINVIPEVNLQLYKTITSDIYFCTVKDYNLVLSTDIVELLKGYLRVSEDVIAIQTKSLHEYQASEMATQDCIIRTVTNSKSASKSWGIRFPKLEQPNIISGVSAGVISLREHQDQSGTAVVCYMEHPEEYRIEEMEILLKKLNISQDSKSRPSSVLNSNLYI